MLAVEMWCLLGVIMREVVSALTEITLKRDGERGNEQILSKNSRVLDG